MQEVVVVPPDMTLTERVARVAVRQVQTQELLQRLLLTQEVVVVVSVSRQL
jgi:hypothetical protein